AFARGQPQQHGGDGVGTGGFQAGAPQQCRLAGGGGEQQQALQRNACILPGGGTGKCRRVGQHHQSFRRGLGQGRQQQAQRAQGIAQQFGQPVGGPAAVVQGTVQRGKAGGQGRRPAGCGIAAAPPDIRAVQQRRERGEGRHMPMILSVWTVS